MISELERLKHLTSSDRQLLVELRNKLNDIYNYIDVIVAHISELEDIIVNLLNIVDETKEILKEKESELDNV